MNKGELQKSITKKWNKTHFFVCTKCRHEWTSKKDIPNMCPECKTKKIGRSDGKTKQKTIL
jgi:predicted Zn-ribbon and HTH transcriptional regulator